MESVIVKGYGGEAVVIKESMREFFALTEPFCILIVEVVTQI